MSWIQTAYLIAEVDRDSADRPVHARPDPALAVRHSGGALYPGVDRLRLQRRLCRAAVFRVVQGFAGGVLIPAVFTAVFLLFPRRLHAVATTIGGVVAVLAPTVGPVVGGWITETWSWPWLFLINVIPGLIVTPRRRRSCCRARTRISPSLPKLDSGSLVLLAAALASLEIGLKQAPHHGWLSPALHGLLAASAVGLALFVRRSLTRGASGGAACHAAAAFVCGRLRLEFLPRRRPVRLGLSDAGLSRLRAPP